MLGEIISGIIGAGASLIGGSENRKAQERANAANLAFSREQLDRNEALQREFAQQSVRWKVADAKAGGIHPLYALGAQTHSFAPSTVGASQEAASMGDSIASAGQNIGRAVQAGMTRDERGKQDLLDTLTLEKAGLENDLLRTQIGQLRQQQIGPAMPTLSQTPSGHPIKTDDIKQQPDVAPQFGQTRFMGVPLKTNPWMMDAEHGEQRYGEIAEQAQGVLNLPADIIYTLYQRWPEISRYIGERYRVNRDYIWGRR